MLYCKTAKANIEKEIYLFIYKGLRMLSVFIFFLFFCMLLISFYCKNSDVFLLTHGVLQKYI